jgi:hypothetical protein
LSFLALTVAALAQQPATKDQPGPWKRHVITAKLDRFDAPEPHPLTFFTRYPSLLDEDGDFCYLCAEPQKLAAAKLAKQPVAEVHFVGVINVFGIYDVFYRFHTEGAVDWKSILVKTGTNLYREIYHRQPTQPGARAWPSAIRKYGTDLLLVASYSIGGMHSLSKTDYYWFGEAGPVLVDVSPIRTAAKSALPEGQDFWDGDDGFMPQPTSPMTFDFGLCCGGKGHVKVKYTLVGGHIMVSEAHYYPK